MAFLQAATPIVRGECDQCGHSRNLWVEELASKATTSTLPCDHRRQGCAGEYRVVFTGPKALLPRRLEDVQCRCQGAAGAGGAGDHGAVLAQLLDMGFAEPRARQAIAACGGDVAAAVEWLMGADEAPSAAGPSSAASCAAASTQASAQSTADAMAEIGECPICCEDLELSGAAMRCVGQAGKRHYFHAHCLAAWIRECQRSGNDITCPQCRGPVQVRPRRLQDFLDNKPHLDAQDRDALHSFTSAVGGGEDDDGWSDVRKDLLKGAMIGVGVGLAVMAIAAGVSALSGSRRERDDRR